MQMNGHLNITRERNIANDFNNASIIVIIVRCCTGLELLIDCWSYVYL